MFIEHNNGVHSGTLITYLQYEKNYDYDFSRNIFTNFLCNIILTFSILFFLFLLQIFIFN